MRILLLAGLAAGAMSLLSPAFAQKMGRDYYENATSTCRVHVWMRTSGRPEPAMTVTPINGGQNLKVVATANGVSCTCLYRPGDADLYPSVRLMEPPVCSATQR